MHLASRYEVHAVVRALPLIPLPTVIYHVLDLAEPSGINFLPRKIDVILHLAQSSMFRDFPSKAMDVFDVNVGSTARLLNYARCSEVRSFVLASSGGIYGAGEEAFKENEPISQHGRLGYYLASKLCAEVLAQNYAPYMNISVLRFFFIYGAGQKRTMLMPRLVDNIKQGLSINLQGEHGIRINPIHVTDAVDALEASMKLNGSHTFNVAGAEILSIREIANIIGKVVGRDPIFNTEEIAPRHLIANIEAMQEALTVPKIKLLQGIGELNII